MEQKIIYDYSNLILKPLDNDNINNSCWINTALYLISAHPYITFQYLLVDDSRLTSKLKKIYNDIYLNNIIYNYKYIKSEKNTKSKILYREKIHKNLYDKIKKNNLIDIEEWGKQWDAIVTLDFLFQIITKTHSYLNNNVYLIIEQRILKNKNDINNILYIKDGITNNTNKLLLGFITGSKCNNYNIYNYGKEDLNSLHWVCYFRENLNNNKLWYKFDGLQIKGKVYIKENIYTCFKKNAIQNLMCIYIDIEKFKKILSNPNIKELYNKYLELIEPLNDINKDTNKKIQELLLNTNRTVGKNNNININLLSIQELEKIFIKKIKNDYYLNNIIDKRLYFKNLIN